jgi:iron complex transport system substrate-binding protein
LLELAPERLVSVSYVADDASVTPVASRFARSIPRVNGSAEQLLFVRPDLVLLSDYNGAATSASLESAGCSVLRVGAATTFRELLAEISRLGRVIGEDERARALGVRIEAELGRLERLGREARGPKRRALLLHSSYAYAAGTLQHDCLARAGLENALERLALRGTPALTSEALLIADPDVMFVAWDVAEPRRLEPGEWPSGYPWRLVRAAQNRGIYAVPQALMASISHHALGACAAYEKLARGRS